MFEHAKGDWGLFVEFIEVDRAVEGKSVWEFVDDCEEDRDESHKQEHESSEFCFVGLFSVVIEFHGDAEEIDFRDPLILSYFVYEFA